MRIVVTGREGQVVSCLIEAAQDRPGIDVVALGRPDLDLARPEGIPAAIAGAAPDLVVSAAAYTAVDQAEDEPGLAFAVNRDGAGAVAAAAAVLGVPVIHLSTDYIFAGDLDRAYVEGDVTGPTGVYGASKLAGEEAVAAASPKHLILRTAWVYSAYGKNFLKTMLRLAETRDELGVVADQWGNPTSAHDITDGILQIATHLAARKDFAAWGIYHLAGTGHTNWADFARHILNTSGRQGGPCARVRDIATADYPTKARRPANSRLDTAKLTTAFGWTCRDWRDATEDVVARLFAAGSDPSKQG
jgi:dTDP-4-dehydrorhamnose reductase